MHELINYVCDELKDLERKAEKGEELSMNEIEYADKLSHIWKSLLTAEAMEESDYSYDMYSNNQSRGRGPNARRDARGRYSRDDYSRRNYSRRDNYSMANDMVSELQDMMEEAPDERTRMEIQKLITKMEQM